MSEREPQDIAQVMGRIDEIVDGARAKDATIEQRLDLLDEAIALCDQLVALVDSTEFSAEERVQVESLTAASAAGTAQSAESEANTPAQPDESSAEQVRMPER